MLAASFCWDSLSILYLGLLSLRFSLFRSSQSMNNLRSIGGGRETKPGFVARRCLPCRVWKTRSLSSGARGGLGSIYGCQTCSQGRTLGKLSTYRWIMFGNNVNGVYRRCITCDICRLFSLWLRNWYVRRMILKSRLCRTLWSFGFVPVEAAGFLQDSHYRYLQYTTPVAKSVPLTSELAIDILVWLFTVHHLLW